MTDEIYEEWKKNWQLLSPLHINYVGDDEKKLKKYFLERFSNSAYSSLESNWKKDYEQEAKKK